MPVIEVFSFGQPTVGTGFGKPAQTGNLLGGEDKAIGYQNGPVAIVRATAGLRIHQVTGDPGVGHFAGPGILKFLKAAAPAAIAQGFPLPSAHPVQRRRFPERLPGHLQARCFSIHDHRKRSLIQISILSGYFSFGSEKTDSPGGPECQQGNHRAGIPQGLRFVVQ